MAANKTLLPLTSFAGTQTRGRFAIIAPRLRPKALRYTGRQMLGVRIV
jgi:hypothetical protein